MDCWGCSLMNSPMFKALADDELSEQDFKGFGVSQEWLLGCLLTP